MYVHCTCKLNYVSGKSQANNIKYPTSPSLIFENCYHNMAVGWLS